MSGEQDAAPPCDFCAGMPAVVYCRADSARLCLPCDRHVHGANTVSTRHARAPLCAACFAAPAAFRRRGGGFLCGNCDFEERGGDGGADAPLLHDRAVVEGYTGCPSIGELAAFLGVGDGCEKAADGGGWWEEPQVLRLEDVIVPTTSWHGLQPLVTTPSSSPKNLRAADGKLDEEVVRQLGDLSKSETASIGHGGFEALNPEEEACQESAASMAVRSCEPEAWIAAGCIVDDPAGACRDGETRKLAAPASSSVEPCPSSFVEISQICPSMSSNVDAARDPATTRTTPSPTKKGGYDVAYPDRGTVISRYKEKRKNRRFGKQIRYESRKARADGRLRIKGRFAKANEI